VTVHQARGGPDEGLCGTAIYGHHCNLRDGRRAGW
jgi:hypothetical protein